LADLRQQLGRFFAEEEATFRKTDNLWTHLCTLYQRDKGIAEATAWPSLLEAMEYLTMSELIALLQRLDDEIFPARDWKRLLVVPPKERWAVYLARIGRLRNRAAHLRNLSFQDTEDLVEDLRKLREDLQRFAFTP
jgi:hypothetical protein